VVARLPACHTGDMAGNTGPTALVTGAAGFIGREVVQVLVARGCQVFGLARSVVSARPASPRWRDRRYGWRSSVAPSTISRNNPELPRAHIRRTRDRCRAGVSVEYTKRARRNGRCVCDPRSRQGSLQLQGGIRMKNSKTHDPKSPARSCASPASQRWAWLSPFRSRKQLTRRL
jgi:NAD dependent epimerase/dehydratase family